MRAIIQSTPMMTNPLMTFEFYYEQIKEFDLLGLPHIPDYPKDIFAKDKLVMIQQNFCDKLKK
jgi:hypothetical protein